MVFIDSLPSDCSLEKVHICSITDKTESFTAKISHPSYIQMLQDVLITYDSTISRYFLSLVGGRRENCVVLELNETKFSVQFFREVSFVSRYRMCYYIINT